MYDRKSFTKTLEVVQDFYEERTVDSGKAQHMLAPSERAKHAKHMMDRHSVKTKFHGKDELSYHGPLSNVKRALSNHYGGDISQAKDLHPIMMKNESVGKTPGDRSYYNLQKAKELAKKAGHDYDKLPQYDRRHNDHKDYFDNKAKNESVENVDENILTRMLPGAHGRYMKKLKVAHDHHKMMEKGHGGLEDKIDPSRGGDDKKNTDPDRQYEHGKATQAHGRAAEAIRKLAVHAKANKLTGHPTKGAGAEFHTSAINRSKESHYDSNNAIKHDEKQQYARHMDHVKTLKKGLGKYHSDDHTHHKSLS